MGKLKFVLAIAVIIGFIYFTTPSVNRNESGQIVTEGSLEIFSLSVGDCFDDSTINAAETVELSEVGGVPCSLPHDNEAYSAMVMRDGAYPGEESVLSTAEEYCSAQFEPFVGIAYESSILDITYIYPTEESWRLGNDREIVCSIYDMSGEKMTGSMKGKEI